MSLNHWLKNTTVDILSLKIALFAVYPSVHGTIFRSKHLARHRSESVDTDPPVISSRKPTDVQINPGANEWG